MNIKRDKKLLKLHYHIPSASSIEKITSSDQNKKKTEKKKMQLEASIDGNRKQMNPSHLSG